MADAMRRHIPFPESVANEKGWEPLLDPSSLSSQIRRRLFRGETLDANVGVALGGTNGILGAATRMMEDWGFEFEVGKSETGKKTVKLKNPEHVPTEKAKRARTGPPRSRTNSKTSDDPVHLEVRARLLSGGPISIAESMEMGVSDAFLRKEVRRLEREGYEFQASDVGLERTYKLKRAPRGAHRDRAATTRALSKTPVRQVGLANGHPQPTQDELMFGQLATPAPTIGGLVRVVGLLLNEEDETLSFIIKNGESVWKTRVEGYADADS